MELHADDRLLGAISQGMLYINLMTSHSSLKAIPFLTVCTASICRCAPDIIIEV